MEPTAIGLKLATAVIGPLVRKFFVSDAPGAGLVDKPVRLSGYVSFKGEKRTLTESDVRTLAAALVDQALSTGERRIPSDEREAVIDALATTLHALGDLTITDVDAVRLGPDAFARELRRAADRPERHLSADATHFYEALLGAASLHILEFFTQRKTFTAHALVSQTRAVDELTLKANELIRRTPLPDAADVAFEATYLPYVAKKHSKLTIYGIDLSNSPTRWSLDVAYLSLEAAPLGRREISWDAYETAEDFLAVQRALEPQPADQALARTRRVLLRGEAGSGKTTLVQWLAVTAAQQERPDRPEYLRDRIPFVLPLRTLTRHGERLPAPKDFLAAIGCPLAGSQPAGWEHRVLSAGRGLILVDGIDEIPDPSGSGPAAGCGTSSTRTTATTAGWSLPARRPWVRTGSRKKGSANWPCPPWGEPTRPPSSSAGTRPPATGPSPQPNSMRTRPSSSPPSARRPTSAGWPPTP